MGHKRRDPHFSSDGTPKASYDRETAERKAARRSIEEGKPYSAYPCKTCDPGWHVGRTPTTRPNTYGSIFGYYEVALQIELGVRAMGNLLAENNPRASYRYWAIVKRCRLIEITFNGRRRSRRNYRFRQFLSVIDSTVLAENLPAEN